MSRERFRLILTLTPVWLPTNSRSGDNRIEVGSASAPGIILKRHSEQASP